MKKLFATILFGIVCFFGYSLQASSQTAVSQPTFKDIAEASLKAFYLIRSGVPIETQYAGEYARPLSHKDTHVLVHPSAASLDRPAGTVISSPLGWYDAGDYNKYVVNCAYSCGLMLLAYEQIPDYFKQHGSNIPESSNRTADILDEVMFSLKWMLTMQDPEDGGVYHKLTTPHFEEFIMPSECKQQRYVVQKSVTATYDFAAIMAQAARIFKGNLDYPEFSTQALVAAEKAYKWAKKHPYAYYDQNKINNTFKPAITTGSYGDNNASDECFWASIELFLMTHKYTYYFEAIRNQPFQMNVPSWASVATLGLLEAIVHGHGILHDKAIIRLHHFAKHLARLSMKSSIGASFGTRPQDFYWGSLANACTQGYILLMADKYHIDKRESRKSLRQEHRLVDKVQTIDKSKSVAASSMPHRRHRRSTQKQSKRSRIKSLKIRRSKQRKESNDYKAIARANMQYILGHNPTGYCFVTAMGIKPVMHPHHRLSAADAIVKPFPGLLVGGPNPGQQDKKDLDKINILYPSKEPALSYLDVTESYASNEIAINWQASLVALASWLASLE